jgi:uncharacterized repeat protein (TIGR01451 family)
MLRALAVSAVALCASAPVFAGTNQFTVLGPEGGFVQKVLIHPTMPSIAYALTGGGYYRSMDSGVTWRMVGGDLIAAQGDVAVDPSDPNRVIVAVPGHSPLVSTDAGATLAAAGNFPSNVEASQAHVEFSADGSVAYVAVNPRIWRSTDGGRNWSERTRVNANSASSLTFLRVDPLDPNVLYVRDLNLGAFRSIDGGGTWQPFNLPPSTHDIVITSTTPQRIWAASFESGVQSSTNGGATWQPAALPPLESAMAIALDPTNESIVYAGITKHGLFRTTDGNAWVNVQGNARVGQVTSIAVSPMQPQNLMLAGGSGIAVSATSGGTWERRNAGIFAAGGGDILVVPGSNRIYLSSSNAGIHFLADGAAGPTSVNNDGLYQLQAAAAQASTLTLLAQGRSPDRLFVGMSGGYARSNDGGDTWHAGTTGDSSNVVRFAGSPNNPDLIVAATFPPDLRRSIDGGDTWTPGATAGLPAGALATAMTFSASSPLTVYAAFESAGGTCCTQHGVHKSVDGGASWTAANAGFIASDEIRQILVDPANADIVYAAANIGGLLKTTNGGTSWTRLPAGGPGNMIAIALDRDVPSIIYAAGSNQFARSVDAGQTWQSLRSDIASPYWVAQALLADPRRASTLLMSTHSHGVVDMTIAPNLALESGGAPINPLQPGAQQTYRYRLRNLGPFHATGARAVVTLPAGTTGISATTTNGSCVVQGITVNCTSPVLQSDAVAEINVSATHSALGTIEVTATTIGDQPDASSANNELRYTVTVAQAVVNPPPSGGGGGGGGGGTSSLLYVLSLAVLGMVRRRIRARDA